MRIFNLWDQGKGEGQQCEMGPSKTKGSLLLTVISQCKQIAIPSANGSEQQLLLYAEQQLTSLEIRVVHLHPSARRALGGEPVPRNCPSELQE